MQLPAVVRALLTLRTAAGHPCAGTTVTVALSIGWLLTIANTGDSATVLDTGCSILELTKSHRIHSNKDEQARLRQAGQQLAPLGFHLQGPAKPGEPGVGPLRLWPGGLCVSRSVGDLDAGPEVVPVPHIRQVRVPAACGVHPHDTLMRCLGRVGVVGCCWHKARRWAGGRACLHGRCVRRASLHAG